MPAVVDELITKFTAQDNISGPTQKMGASLRSFNVSGAAMSTGLAALSGAVALFGVAVMAKGVQSLVALGTAATGANAKLDTLTKGLTAVTGSAEATEEQMKRLREIAKLPGLELNEAVQAFTDLRAAGIDATIAERSLKAFGNALATVGRGGADLSGVLYGLRQLSTSDSIKAEDLNIITERVPQATKALRELYGTSRGEELMKMGLTPAMVIDGLLSKLEELPQATSGVENAGVNLASAWQQVLAVMGGPLNGVLVPIMEKVTKFFEYVAESGLARKIGSEWAKLFNGDMIGDGLIKFLAFVAAGLKNLPQLIGDIADQFKNAILMVARITDVVIMSLNRIPGLKLPKLETAAKAGFVAAMGQGILGEAGKKFAYNTVQDADKLVKLFGESGGAPSGNPGAGPNGNMGVSATQTTLERIEQNTRPLLDFKQFILGGGELGGSGITPSEIHSLKGGKSVGGNKGQIQKAVTDLAEVIMRVAYDEAARNTGNQRRMGILPS